jgi:acyl-CoA thioester hydrolase
MLDILEPDRALKSDVVERVPLAFGLGGGRIALMLEHALTFRVRYPEADPMGFVHHSRYLQYFEMGRVELLRAQGFSYADLERQGVFFAVTKAQVQYRAPARFDDELTLLTRIVRQTTVRIDHEYTLKRVETLIAEGSTTIACLDRQGQLRHIPEFLGGPPAVT